MLFLQRFLDFRRTTIFEREM